MVAQPPKSYNLPWHLNDHYWLCIYPKGSVLASGVSEMLQKLGFQKQASGACAIRTSRDWKQVWDKAQAALLQLGAMDAIDATVTAGEQCPDEKHAPDNKTVLDPSVTAGSMWIGEALLADRIMCYLQPVMTGKNQVFGYESFARVKGSDGAIIDGGQIVNACKVMGIEHTIDRHLHVQAIKTFANSEFNGFLFVNFFPGFIHRPAIYLEGLSETAKSHGVIAKHIVLDFTKSETPHDMEHVRNVSAYGRSCGYSVALDDIASVEIAKKLVKEVRPDFVKIDMHLVQQVNEGHKKETIRTLVNITHDAGATVIAEGVESEDIFEALKLLNVDLYQGYLFSPPLPVETALKRSGTL